MDYLASIVYSVCIAMKLGAMNYAVRAWYLFSKDFADPRGSIKNTRKSQMERLFQITLLGTIANIMFLPALIFYILFYHGYTLGWVEALFLGGHFFDSAYSLSAHHHTYQEAKRHKGVGNAR